MDIDKIKNKPKSQITRADIAELLKSIGEPGEKRDEKAAAVAGLLLKNPQGIDASESLVDFEEY